MARIQHVNPDVHQLNHDGEDYEAAGDGVFEVPEHVAAQLVSFPHWRRYDGNPWPREKTAEELEEERLSGVVERALEQKAEPKPRREPRQPKAKAEKKAPAKREAKRKSRPAAEKKGEAKAEPKQEAKAEEKSEAAAEE